MKLTCLSKGSEYYFPPCHILDICGFRLLLECPVDLSALAVFCPVTSVIDNNEVGLIRAVPRYKTVRNFPIADVDVSLIDVVLVSTPPAILGLPFLTRNQRFSAKIYATEVTSRIGRIMMEELVAMHQEFLQVYGSDENAEPADWMSFEELEMLPLQLREILMGQTGKDWMSWLPLYSAVEVSKCMEKVHTLKYAEECCYNGALVFKPFSSGLEIGASNWTINSPRWNLTYLSSSLFKPSLATKFDYHSLRGSDVILFSDFSSLHAHHNVCMSNEDIRDNLNGSENTNSSSNCQTSRETLHSGIEIIDSSDVSETQDELEKLRFICSCVVDSVKDGGSILIPVGRLSIVLLLLELISDNLKSSNVKVPIYMISSVAEETLAYVNALPEWFSEDYQQKLFSGKALFSHLELIGEKRLSLFPAIHSSSLLTVWQEPCVVFAPHWSLRSGPIINLLRLWHAKEKCLLILEQGTDADIVLLPYKPAALKVLQCSFLSGIATQKMCSLLEILQPKLVIFPDDLKTMVPFTETVTWSFLFYTDSKPVHVPKVKHDFELQMSTELTLQLQPRRLKQQNIAIARLIGKLSLSNGRFFLVPTKKLESLSHRKKHWGCVDQKLLLTALHEKGVDVLPEDGDPSGCDVYHVNITGSDAVAIRISASETLVNYPDEETLVTNINEALNRAIDGI